MIYAIIFKRGFMSFKDFWTNENNPILAKSEYLYNFRHIFILLLAFTLCVVLAILFRKKNNRKKYVLLYIFGSVFIFFEIISRLVNLIILEEYSWLAFFKIMLPMHLFSVMILVFIIAIYTRKQFLFNFACIVGLLVTSVFLLYPTTGLNRVYMNFTCLHSTISHILGFVCSVLLITLGIAKFEFEKIWQSLVCFIVMFCWGAICNFVIFPSNLENYMYMIKDPFGLNLNFPHQILYIGIILVYITIFYVVYWVNLKIKNRKKKTSV